MALTLEPSIEAAAGAIMAQEENILVTGDKPLLLTRRAAPELPGI